MGWIGLSDFLVVSLLLAPSLYFPWAGIRLHRIHLEEIGVQGREFWVLVGLLRSLVLVKTAACTMRIAEND